MSKEAKYRIQPTGRKHYAVQVRDFPALSLAGRLTWGPPTVYETLEEAEEAVKHMASGEMLFDERGRDIVR